MESGSIAARTPRALTPRKKRRREFPYRHLLAAVLVVAGVYLDAQMVFSAPLSKSRNEDDEDSALSSRCRAEQVRRLNEEKQAPAGFSTWVQVSADDYVANCDGTRDGHSKRSYESSRPHGIGEYAGALKEEASIWTVYEGPSARVEGTNGRYFQGSKTDGGEGELSDSFFRESHTKMALQGDRYVPIETALKSTHFQTPAHEKDPWSKTLTFERKRLDPATGKTDTFTCVTTFSGKDGEYSEQAISLTAPEGKTLKIGGAEVRTIVAAYRANQKSESQLYLSVDDKTLAMQMANDALLRSDTQTRLLIAVRAKLGLDCSVIEF